MSITDTADSTPQPAQSSTPEIKVLEYCNDKQWYHVNGVKGCVIKACQDCGNAKPFESTTPMDAGALHDQTFYVIRAHPHDRETLDYAYEILLSNFDDVVLSKILVSRRFLNRFNKSVCGLLVMDT
jgi:hypothetical protein